MRMVALVLCLFALPAVAADPEAAAVQVIRPTGEGNASGTVVHVADGASWVVTCRHVVSDASRAPRWDWVLGVRCQGKCYPAQLKGYNERVDLAILKVPAVLPVAQLAGGEPEVGAAVRLFGYGGPALAGKALGVVDGYVSGKGECIYADFKPTSGDSGSAMFNAAGEVVGVCWGWGGPHRSAGAVQLPDIRQVLTEVMEADTKPKATPPPAVIITPAGAFNPPARRDCQT